MRSRFLLLPSALLLVLGTTGARAGVPGSTHPRGDRPVTRADVLAGRASRGQALDLLRASVEAAGGETVQATAGVTAVGGYVYPITSLDLDGDGDDETLLSQYAERSYLVAVDDRGVLWRVRQPKKSFIVGVLPAELSPAGGEEALLVAFRYKKPWQALVAGAGADGVLWTASIPAEWFEVNGLVQADGDAGDEVALTVWDPDLDVAIHTLEGDDGTTISVLRSTLEERVDVGWRTETFVTDGPPGSPDEAVFVTAVPTGFYAERRSLADGRQVTYRLAPNTAFPQLYQGSDYTGDGRRDAFVSLYPSYGVFDAVALQTAWSVPSPGQDTYAYPFPAGDLNQDGGDELCLAMDRWVFDPETEQTLEVGAGARCHAGVTGALLWEASRSRTLSGQEDGYAYTQAGSDLDGDGHPDPVILMETYECVETQQQYSCQTLEFEAVALSGLDGSELWNLTDPATAEKVWGLTDSNLDGNPGDDGLDWVSAEDDTPDAQFAVRNGLTLASSWKGEIDTGDLPGYPSGAVDADLDADGSAEAVVTADAYEILGDPECNGPCLYVSHAYVAAFEPGGNLLWQLEL